MTDDRDRILAEIETLLPTEGGSVLCDVPEYESATFYCDTNAISHLAVACVRFAISMDRGSDVSDRDPDVTPAGIQITGGSLTIKGISSKDGASPVEGRLLMRLGELVGGWDAIHHDPGKLVLATPDYDMCELGGDQLGLLRLAREILAAGRTIEDGKRRGWAVTVLLGEPLMAHSSELEIRDFSTYHAPYIPKSDPRKQMHEWLLNAGCFAVCVVTVTLFFLLCSLAASWIQKHLGLS
jgi:hypothetical protein